MDPYIEKKQFLLTWRFGVRIWDVLGQARPRQIIMLYVDSPCTHNLNL